MALVAIAEAVHLESGRIDVDEAVSAVNTDRLSVDAGGQRRGVTARPRGAAVVKYSK